MFGSKKDKQERHERIQELIQANEAGMTQAELARQCLSKRSTIHKDLAELEEHGVVLAEDERGKLHWPFWLKGKT